MENMDIPVPLPRVRNFEKLGFGMFVHWGLYAQLGKGEWAKAVYDMPDAEYNKLFDSFTAADFDGEALAKTAHDAGMKYIVLTTRHHEGFSLYDTCGLSSFDAPHSPAKRDLVAEYVAGCRKYDIIPFFYHTTLDWHWEGKNTHSISEEDFKRYLEYLRKSVEILCKNYGPIGGLWFDGNWTRPQSDWEEDKLYATIRHYQPEAIIINNTGIHQLGKLGHPEIDSVTFENNFARPMDRRGHAKYVASEMCITMNSHWGLGAKDVNFLSPGDVIERLALARGCGANLLLNIGPTAQGGVPEYERATLNLVGKWHDIFKEALHDPVPAPECRCSGRNFVLKDGKNYYYFVFRLGIRGDENVIQPKSIIGTHAIDNFTDTVTSVRWMDNNEDLAFIQAPDKGMLAINCTAYPYGTDLAVRVAKITVE